MSTEEEVGLHSIVHSDRNQDCAPRSRDRGACRAVGGCPLPEQVKPVRPYRDVDVVEFYLEIIKDVLDSDERTNRVLRLVLSFLGIVAFVILGLAVTATVAVIAMNSDTWLSVASGLGLTAIGGAGMTSVHRVRKRGKGRRSARSPLGQSGHW